MHLDPNDTSATSGYWNTSHSLNVENKYHAQIFCNDTWFDYTDLADRET